jgi:type VI secretion system secreted protein Hcp
MAQADYFLDLDSVDGESQDDDSRMKNKIHVSSFSFGVTNTGTGGSNLGSGASKSNVQDLHVTKTMDKASPNLFIGCCNGKHFPKATFYVRRAGENPQVYLKYELTEVFISSYSTSGHEGGGIAQESVSLNFSKVKMSYFVQKADGTGTTEIPKTWDLKANKAS